MFNRVKESAKITDQDPSFKARYIGSVETFTASGKGCTHAPVQKLWDNAMEERYLKRIEIRINPFGIHMRYLDKKQSDVRLFSIENISFCNVDSIVNDKIFSFIHKDEDGPLECHAVLCSNTEKAKSMAMVLARAFQIAYKEWKADRSKMVREVEKTERKASIAKMSMKYRGKDSNIQTDAISECASSSGSEPGTSAVGDDGSSSARGTSGSPEVADMAVQADFTETAVTAM